MKKSNEKAISQIILKYYKQTKKNDTFGPVFKCARCFTLSHRTGGGFIDQKGKVQQICETCAVWEYREEHGFKTLTAARARRRRIFDVGYLFNETVLDAYMGEKGINDIKECANADDVFIKAAELYNFLFSKEEKVRLEEVEDQKDIQSTINLKLLLVDFEKFSGDL